AGRPIAATLDDRLFSEQLGRLIELGAPIRNQEMSYRTNQGVTREISISISVMQDRHPEGTRRPRPGATICILHDITGRKWAEERVQHQLQRLAALRNIDIAITASLDLRVTLNIILDQVIGQLGVDAADVLLLNTHIHALEHAAGCGF